MHYLESPSADPTFNLALEQYIFDRLPRSRSYFMLWQNHNAIIVGKHQNTAAEVNADFLRDHGIQVVRRLSGGGAVYHDGGNLNFTFVVDGAPGAPLDLGLFCTPMAQALRRLGIDAQVSGRNDITVGGMKFSGNAQYVKEGRVMHHGTILFDSDLSVVAQALNVSGEKLRSKGVQSVRSRVTNLKPYLPQGTTLQDFKALLLDAMFCGAPMEPYPLTADDLDGVEALRRARYATWEWNYGASPPHALHRQRRVEGCGSVEVYLAVKAGRIADLTLQGDWFGDSAPLCQDLIGLPLTAQALAHIDPAPFIIGLTNGDLLSLLL